MAWKGPQGTITVSGTVNTLMEKTYVGHLSQDDPLHGYLQNEIQPQITGVPGSSTYRVFRLNGSNDVYQYEDRLTGTKFIGKFFLSAIRSDEKEAASRLTLEFDNLSHLRRCGLADYPHHVAKPLGRNYSMNALLVTEDCEGEILSEIILEALDYGEYDKLYHKLTALAYFFSAFHNRTATGEGVDFNVECDYMDSLTERLLKISAIDEDKAGS